MAKTKSFRVVNSRFHFKCCECQTKRIMTIGPAIRKRSIRCHKCKELTRCVFNRRLESREQQLGKVLLTITGGREFDASLYDNSPHGVGFNMSIRDVKRISVGMAINLRCPWNQNLLGYGPYIVTSIRGHRIGAKAKN